MTLPRDIDEPNAEVSGYRFAPPHLAIDARPAGISGFTRVRNGQDFIEATIRSHIDYLDEMVVVHNRCTDATPDILAGLQREFGSERLRVMHYTDPIYPPGSQGHASTAPDQPRSMVNYSNFALAATRYAHVTKVDDDHLALDANLAAATAHIRQTQPADAFLCFSGLNLARRADGSLGVAAHSPLSGSGDIGFFKINARAYFRHDRRFERVGRGGLPRRFIGFLYWHLKYLKAGMGFANYDLADNPGSRFARRKRRLEESPLQVWEPHALRTQLAPGSADRLLALVSGKKSVNLARDTALGAAFPDHTIHDALRRTVRADLLATLFSQGARCPAA